jgi:hypothetical protein
MTEPTTPSTTRPRLLTVLCVLSFVWAAFTLWGGIQSAFVKDVEEMLRVAREQNEATLAQPGAPDVVLRMAESSVRMSELGAQHRLPLGLLGIAGALLNAFGVYRLFKLRRSGFPIYLIGTFLELVVPMLFVHSAGLMAWGTFAIMALVAVVFAVLYASHLKHMH